MSKKSELGENIRNYRKLRFMTQAQLAERIGMSQSTVGMYETGRREPDMDQIEAIADALNVSMRDLLPEGRNEISKDLQMSPERIKLLELARVLDESLVDQATKALQLFQSVVEDAKK